MIKLKQGNGPSLLPPTRAGLGGTSKHDVVPVYISGGTSQSVVVADAGFDVYESATYYRGGVIRVEELGPASIKNLNTSVGTVAEGGTITRLSEGVMNLKVKTPIAEIPIRVDLRNKTEADQPHVFAGTVEGSLAAHIQEQVEGRLSSIGGTPTKATNGMFFTSQDHSGQIYTRNPNLWLSQGTPVDLTCISPWNSNGANRKAGTLVTPRHVLNAAHYEYSVGNTVRFVAMDGTVHNRTITGKKRHPNYSPYSPDLTIYTLDSDLPATITPCKMMPSDWNEYLVQNYHNRPPALGLDQEEKALIIDFYTNGSFLIPKDATRLIFHESKISGDSGNPAFLIVNDELVLITCWTYGGVGRGTPVADYISDLNQMIVDADTQAVVTGPVADPTWPNANDHYQLKPADFSAFPNYA